MKEGLLFFSLTRPGATLTSRLGMRRVLETALCVLIAASITSQVRAAGCATVPTNLVSWWTGDGNPADREGTNDGQLQGGATASGVGLVSSAFGFNGSTAYVQIPDSPSLRPGVFTLEAWVKFTSLNSTTSGNAPQGRQYIIFKQNTRSSNFEAFNIYKDRISNVDYFLFGVSSASGQGAELRSTISISTNVWYHVAGVRTATTVQLYVNGQLQGQANANFAQDYGNFPLYFGTTGQTWDGKLAGQLDEVSLYNRALSAGEIGAIFSAGAAGKCFGLSIVSQPLSQTNILGGTATLTVTGTGDPPIAYQWLFNGEPIPGAVETNLVLTGLQTTNAGNYSVVLVNPNQSVTSSVASLTVLLPPEIATQPQNSTNLIGSTAIFSATAAGSAPLSYRWLLNGAGLTNGPRVTGATSPALQITAVQFTDSGAYSLMASNPAGVVTSAVALLTITGPPGIVTQPASKQVALGGTASFAVAASGTPPLGYQWFRGGQPLANGGNITGAATPVLTIQPVQAADAGNYSAVVSNNEGSVTSLVAALTISFPPVIIAQPASQTVKMTKNASFQVSVTGTPPFSYRWLFNGAPLSDGSQVVGSGSSNLLLSYILPANAGGYAVVVTNLVGSITSAPAVLTVDFAGECTAVPSGLVGWWPGDGSGRDIAGTNHGTLLGGSTATSNGVTGLAFDFDGTNKYVRIPDAPALKPTNLTVVCWVMFDNLDAPGTSPYVGQQYLVYKQNTRVQDFEGYVLSKDRTHADIILWEVTSAAGQLVRIDSVSPVATNVWYHLAAVRGSNYISLYFNGQLEAQTSVNFPQDYGTLPVYFGTSGQAYYDRRLNGKLDEVMLFNRVLSAEEITALYSSGPFGSCKGTNGIIISSQPQSQAVQPGQEASFFVEATGLGVLSYQWRFNGTVIPGATESNLHLTNVQPENQGQYQVYINDITGTLLSAPASLSLAARPSLSNARVLANGLFSLTVNGSAGAVYAIEGSPDVAAWTEIGTVSNATGQVDFIDPASGTNAFKFYRARVN